jgi:hypothetical protein
VVDPEEDMARKQKAQSAVGDVQAAVAARVGLAKKRVLAFERQLVRKGRGQQREFEAMLRNLRTATPVRRLGKRAEAASTEARRRLDGLQRQVLSALGVASRNEIVELNRELTRISKRVDALAARRVPGSSS